MNITQASIIDNTSDQVTKTKKTKRARSVNIRITNAFNNTIMKSKELHCTHEQKYLSSLDELLAMEKQYLTLKTSYDNDINTYVDAQHLINR